MNDSELFDELFGGLDDVSNQKNLMQELAVIHTADFMYIMKRCVNVGSLDGKLLQNYYGSTTDVIGAIKHLRSKTGMSLHDAKDYVQELFAREYRNHTIKI